ncbi:hypothetical protein ACQJBY_032518 [Aegilops geniculata]
MRRGPGEASLRRRRAQARLLVAVAALVTCTIWLWSSSTDLTLTSYKAQDVHVNKLWRTANSNGWRASSAPRSYWPPPPTESETNGYLRVRCNGGLNQQRTAICNAVVAARIMNATLVLPELDTNSFWRDERCIDIFTPQEQKILIKYRKENFAEKELVYRERRLIGKCPLTPEEVGLILRALGFDNTTHIYLASGELFGGKRFMRPFKAMFPRLENHSSVGPGKLEENTRGLAGSAVDYMVCLLSDIFMPTYDGPSNFANNLIGHRLYYGFRTTITPNRKALAPIFMDREVGSTAGFEERVRQVMMKTYVGGPHKRIHPEPFYTNSWPECFCQENPRNHADKCPPDNIYEVLENQFRSEENEESIEVKATSQTVSISQTEETVI